MTTRFPPNARHVQPGRRRLTFESLEQRCMLAHGDSYRDLVNIDMTPFSPHVPFIVVNENPDFEVNASGLTPITDAAILIHGNLRSLQPDNYRFAARKGDIVAIFSSLFQTNLNINGTYPSGSFASSQTFFTKYFFTAPATKEYEFSVGGQFGAVGNYELGLAIIPNLKPVAQFSFTSSTATDTSYDPEEQVIGSSGITQRQWSTGGTGVTTSFNFATPGTYPVTLTVTSNDGETASVTHDIVVVAPTTTGQLSSLQFVGDSVSILPDPGTNNPLFDSNPNRKDYEADANQDGTPEQQQPVLYAAGAVPTVDATFELSPGASGQYSVKGIQGTGADQFVFEGVATAANGLLSIQGLQAKVAAGTAAPKTVGDQVKKYDDFAITWTITKSGGQSVGAGSSHNRLYVSAKTPVTEDARYETVVKEAVTRAESLGLNSGSDLNAFLAAVWPYFSNLPGGHQRDSSGVALTYYGNGDATPYSFTTKSLLETHDGRCEAWASFFVDMLAVNGIVLAGSDGLIELLDKYNLSDWLHGTAERLLVGVYKPFPATGTTGDATYPYWLDKMVPSGATVSDIEKVTGLIGPNNPNVTTQPFKSHVVVQIAGHLYDPSYGFVANNIQDWEDSALAGLATKPSSWGGFFGSTVQSGWWVRKQVQGVPDLDFNRLPIQYLASSAIVSSSFPERANSSSALLPDLRATDVSQLSVLTPAPSGTRLPLLVKRSPEAVKNLRGFQSYVTMKLRGEAVDMAMAEFGNSKSWRIKQPSEAVIRRQKAGFETSAGSKTLRVADSRLLAFALEHWATICNEVFGEEQ